MKTALCQMLVAQDKNANLKTAETMIQEAALNHADIIVLPEMFNCPYSNAHFPEYAEAEGGQTYTFLSRLAKKHSVYLVGGSIPEREGARIYNTAYVFNREGLCIGKHRKAHLFDVDIPGGIRFLESETLTPGNQTTTFVTEFGKMGLAICYDMRFPEFFRKMALEGALLIFVPAAFNMTTGPAHWELTARARALDNQIYMALCSPARNENGVYVAFGHSMVTNPWGDVLAALDEKAGIVYADVDTKKIEEVRAGLPLLKHRRPALYEID
jgi:predicted amidohydrolase